jgi:glycine/D-amino acid oxidase-like deaminating enzyme
MIRYGRSPWLDGFPKSRVPSFPRHRANELADVVVIGGGLTGCAAAHALVSAGQNVILLEAGRIGQGSAFSTGWVNDDPGLRFAELAKAVGVRRARWAFQAWRHAALDLRAQLKRLNVKCALEPALSLTTAVTPDQAATLARDYRERKAAGLDAAALNARAAMLDSRVERALGGLRTREGATLDPYRATLGFAAAAKGKGAQIFEGSPAKTVTFTRKVADVFTAGGKIRTKKIVVATGTPTDLYRSLKRHFWFHRVYTAVTAPMPAKIRKALGPEGTVVRDAGVPPHVVRWMGGTQVLIAGADSPPVPERLLEKTTVQRTGELMYELSTFYPEMSGTPIAYGWSEPYARTAEGIPYIGPHRNFPFHVFAWGDSSHGVTGAYLASRIAARYCLDETDASDAAFDFNR